jgi:hypothetical protein
MDSLGVGDSNRDLMSHNGDVSMTIFCAHVFLSRALLAHMGMYL